MIIFLNGSINAGKSTVAKILAKEMINTALLEIDAFHEMIEWMPIDKAVPINLENALSVIRNFVKRELNVIVPYPLSQKNYDFITSGLKDLDTEIHVFTLAPKLEKVLENRGTRELTEQEKERIKHHYDIGIPNPKFGEIINNSDQTPQETADYILSKINKN
jgi:adenylate kinase family enzyme